IPPSPGMLGTPPMPMPPNYRAIRTDSTGRYTVGLAPGTYQLYASATGYTDSMTLSLPVAGSTETENFVLVAGGATANWLGYSQNWFDPSNWSTNAVPDVATA